MIDLKNIKFVGLTAKITSEIEANYKYLAEILSRYDTQILLEKGVAQALGLKGYELLDMAKKSSFIISLGGDGTMISVCRKTAKISPFVLGIHAGTLGFLTDITIKEAEVFFDEFFRGKFDVEEPCMLDVFIEKKSGEILKKIAFNDAVIMRSCNSSVAKIQAFLNDKIFNSYFGDGVIISTPVGSTAYNMSAGGAILYPLSEAFAITPICSHSLTQRSVILPKDFMVEFRAFGNEILVLDGQDEFKMNSLNSVKISLSSNKARLIRHIGRDYFQILKEKLRWGQE